MLDVFDAKNGATELYPLLRIIVLHYVDVAPMSKGFKHVLSSVYSYQVAVVGHFVDIIVLVVTCLWHL